MSQPAAVVCFALVSKSNKPLYLKTFSSSSSADDGLRFKYHVHSALDIIDEKLTRYQQKDSEADFYLGMLCHVEFYKVYGFVTNSHLKFMCIVEDGRYGDASLKRWFQGVHKSYIKAVCNPFFDIIEDDLATNATFTRSVDEEVRSFSERR
jgi:hypothetical protein